MKTNLQKYSLLRSAILSTSLLFCGCALIPQPDTCECSKCLLEPPPNAQLIELHAAANHSISGNTAEVEICACRPWNSSGIKVATGEQYLFSIIKETEQWVDGSTESTPENGWTGVLYNIIGNIFSPLRRSDKANWYSLIGAIGRSEEDTFAVFKRGRQPTEVPTAENASISSQAWLPVTMDKEGELHFYANDMKGRYFNNKGSLRLQILRIK